MLNKLNQNRIFFTSCVLNKTKMLILNLPTNKNWNFLQNEIIFIYNIIEDNYFLMVRKN